ncbi:hypothetical protein GTY65_19095 [Streptomyces sp. SID8379]|uniref:hypothetical protein n=1 Tax=unclassified Streptomyces TaxID=2593676 RepID=UPI00037B2257|nr:MULTISPECIES: hypothetical protein [unclassified Streptomyces]MYW66140.1 hypothetical protein [Streptomyces sp. SID8379]
MIAASPHSRVAVGYGALCVAHDGEAAFGITVTLVGLGVGLLSGGLPSLVAERAPAGQSGIAAGVSNTVRTPAGGVAGGLFAVVLGSVLLADAPLPSVEAYRIVWLTCALSGLVAAGLVLFARRRTTG